MIVGMGTAPTIAQTLGMPEGGGTIVDSPPINPCIRQLPGWCDWMPFSSYASSCQPYSDVELHRMSICMAEPVARVNPDLAAEGIATADAVQKQLQDPANTPASDTCELNAAVNHPTLSKLFGPKAICTIGGGGKQDENSVTPYLVIGGIIIAAIWAAGRFVK